MMSRSGWGMGLLGLGLVVAGAPFGCGSGRILSTEGGPPETDSGQTPTDSGAPPGSDDASVPEAPVDAGSDGCAPIDASLADFPLLPASDAGGAGSCAACIQSSCQSPLQACIDSCSCRGTATECFADAGSGTIACLTADPTLRAVLLCVVLSCSGSCANLLSGGGGGGGPVSDASTPGAPGDPDVVPPRPDAGMDEGPTADGGALADARDTGSLDAGSLDTGAALDADSLESGGPDDAAPDGGGPEGSAPPAGD